MKIGLLTDAGVHPFFDKNQGLNEIYIFNSLEEINTNLDILIVDNKYVSVNKYIQYIDTHQSKIKQHFFIMSDENNSLKNALLKSKNVTILPASYTERQILSYINEDIENEADKDENVIVFFGADSKVGTTMIAQSVAEQISENENIRVLFAILDGTPGMDYIQNADKQISIDDMRAKVINNMLSKTELMDICLKQNNLYVLQGTQSYIYRRYYHPEHVEAFLKQLSEAFDIVIVDAGSNVELGMTIGALTASCYRFLVCTQQSNCLRNFNRLDIQILSKLKIKEFFLIVNKYIENDQLPNGYKLADLYDAPFICTVPYSEYGLQAEIEQFTIQQLKDDEYKNAIGKIVDLIGAFLGMEFTEKKQPVSIFDKVFKYKRVKQLERTI